MKKLIENVTIAPEEREKLMPHLSNWVQTSRFLSRVKDENVALKLMILELIGKSRLEVVLRIYSRFNVLRKIREKDELMKLFLEGKNL